MKKFRTTFTTAMCACAAAFALSACGGGGNSSAVTSQSGAQTITTVSGIAAAGAPLAGTVYLNYSSNPMKEINATINQDGTFSFDVAGLKPPFVLKAVDPSGNIYYSFAKAPGIANINPLTTLAVAVGAKAKDMGSLADLYANQNITARGFADAITKASADLVSSLQLLLAPYGATAADPLAGPYCVNKQGLDALFEQVAMTVSGWAVTMTRKDTQATVYTAPIDNIRYGGEVTTVNMPTPEQHPMPGNAVLTLKLQGNLPHGTLVKNMSLSVNLPLGVDVNRDSGDATGLTADVNTAIPIGVAAGASVYPAPSISATNNILSINMASPAGFGTGDFLTLRLIFPTASLMTTTTTASFSITASNMYADVYKSMQVKGLAVVPVTLAYPTAEGKKVYDSFCARCHTLEQSDSVVTTTLYGKTSLLSGVFKAPHHGVTLTADQFDNLTAYLNAYYQGQQILIPAN